MNKLRIICIVREALESRGYAKTEANKFISILTSVKFVAKDMKEDVANIFNDFWGASGPDCFTERHEAAV
uniref:Uncharacterized protein n=1 Tax=viral metagenome TaxID=1070528 RepID=A0A6M3IUP5_9ZZZZ